MAAGGGRSLSVRWLRIPAATSAAVMRSSTMLGFLAGLRELGYDEGRIIDNARRFADGFLDRLTPAVIDVVTGRAMGAGRATDHERSWAEYRRTHPDRRVAVGKRSLSRSDLRATGCEMSRRRSETRIEKKPGDYT